MSRKCETLVGSIGPCNVTNQHRGEARDEAGVCGGGGTAESVVGPGCGKAVDAFLNGDADTLKGGGEVAFTGFGKFSSQHRAARTGVNPRNPTEKVHIPAAQVPKFSRPAVR